MKNNAQFIYFNPNPDARLNKKTGQPYRWNRCDCSVRCFCGLLNKTWSEIYKDLCEVGASLFEMPDSPKVIEAYAKKIGLVKRTLPAYMEVSEFVRLYPGNYICNIRSHVFCVRSHHIFDTWNPGNYKMKTYYELVK